MSSQILPTVLATSQPRNFETGFAFFPTNTSLQNPALPQFIGWDGSEPDFGEDLLNLRIPILLWRLRTRVNARFLAAAFIGYNLQYTVSGGLNTGGQSAGVLRVRDDASEGGAGVALGWDIRMIFGIDTGTIGFTWRSGFRTTWQEAFSFNVDASIDLLSVAVDLLRNAGFNFPFFSALLDVGRFIATDRTFWGLRDRASNQMARLGYLELKPKVALHGDLLKAAGKISTKIGAVLKGLKAVGIKAAAGPVLNIYFPVRMEIVRLSTEYGTYDITANPVPGQPEGTYFLAPVGRTQVPPGSPPVQDVSVIHQHRIDIKVGLAIKLKIKFWSIFSQEVSIPIDLTEFIPAIRGSLFTGPYFNQLSAKGGNTAAELPEVIWG